MAANTSTSLVGLDFDSIKNNLLNYLQSQDTFKDYNFQGSGLSVLLDVLAYNTQYNAFYLNMVANEMFLDTALQRSSVVSHAKLLNYTPKSAIAPTAFVDITVNNVGTTSLTLPSFTNFLSESVNGVNYNFVTTKSTTVSANNNTVNFYGVELKQGIPVKYTFTVNSTTNPTYTFQLPDSDIDTSTISVSVQNSSSNNYTETFVESTNYLTLTPDSRVYFLQESLNGNYEISFGDNILGRKLDDNNVVIVNYLITQGTSSAGANNFVLMDSIPNFGTTSVKGNTPASQGSEKESIDSIKYQAPKSYSAQRRAVTNEDYITAIQQNNIGFNFDAVNVWGGQDNDPPVYGQIFVCLKPKGSYTFTSTQKQRIISDILKPISIVTVEPTIVDPDYTYIVVNSNVVYDPKKTTLVQSDIQNLVQTTISNFAANNLNTFNSTFSASELMREIQIADRSIVANEISIKLQKKLYPIFGSSISYNLNFTVPLQKGILTSGISSTPSLTFNNPYNLANTINDVYIEEIPTFTAGIDTINIINSGYNYTVTPTITITGDGSGATANATIDSLGRINSILVTNSGNNYTSAVVTITNGPGDNRGTGGQAVAVLKGRYGQLRSYYYNSNNVKTILNPNIGIVDYTKGIITLNSFNPIDSSDPLGSLSIITNPVSSIISSTFDKIITIDPFDPNAITVNVTAKT